MTTVGNLIKRLEQFAPTYLAEDWDPIGLSFGSNDQKVERVMVALDLDANTLKEAKEQQVDFIFTHHPTIFSAITSLNEHDARRREYIELIRSNIALYSAHTNIDAAEDGMNDWLAESLDLEGPYDVMDASYEEPVYHLIDVGKKDKTYGIGRVGTLTETQTFGQMIEHVKEKFGISHLRYANGDLNTAIKKVAVLGGSGEKYYEKALAQDADLYITGDISYHGAQDMIRDGLLFIDAGHFIENIFVEKMTEKLEAWNQEEGWGIEIIPATSQEDVFRFN